MKNYFALLLLLISLPLFAQKTGKEISRYPIDQQISKALYPNRALTGDDEHAIINTVRDLIPELKNIKDLELKVSATTKSLTAKHYQLYQFFNGIKIYRSEIKVSISDQNIVRSVLYNSYNYTAGSTAFPSESIISNYTSKISHLQKAESEFVYFPESDQLTPAVKLMIQADNDRNCEVILNAEGEIIYTQDLNAYHTAATDSVATALIFMPDPLTPGNISYAAPYNDNADNDTPELTAARTGFPLTVAFSNDTFYMQNAFAKITEHSNPNIPAVYSLSNVFDYTRTQSGFEDVNTLLHITRQQLHLRSLGYTNLVNYQIQVDTHGLNGQDNSMFTSTTSPPRLTFGEGGVDDAEDADVVVHEYGHAISFSAAPNTNTGSQRQALDEAVGDIFACGYSKDISNNFWFNTFTWDGHNEFWVGRVTNSTKHYPNNLGGGIHADGEIWASVIMEIENVIGRDTAEKILLESMFSWSSNMSMSQAAQFYIMADSALYNGSHNTTICTYFYNRGLVSQCERYTGISETRQQKFSIYPNPAENFIQMNKENLNYKIYDSTGKLVMENKSQNGYVSIENLCSGIYILFVFDQDKTHHTRFIKL